MSRSNRNGRIEVMRGAADEEEAVAQFQGEWTPSADQENAFNVMRQWAAKPTPLLTLGGYAGTGKTTLLGAWAKEVTQNRRVAFCTFTGKASQVLSRSLRARDVYPEYVGTIHRLMYRPIEDKVTGRITGWRKREFLDFDLLVVDEASMVPKRIKKDLMGYRLPILAVGDHGQLPPVGEDAGLMSDPDLRLETVHRQALDNPIVALSVHVRQGRDLRPFVVQREDARLILGQGLTDLQALLEEWYKKPADADDTLTLCYSNAGRVKLNRMIRSLLGFEGRPRALDRVICVKNAYFNDWLLANGQRGFVERVSPWGVDYEQADVAFPAEGVRLKDGRLCSHQFDRSHTYKELPEIPGKPERWSDAGLFFDYGYALTVHKAQGSQARRVLVTVESPDPGGDEYYTRWLYTAVTRASEELVLVTG